MKLQKIPIDYSKAEDEKEPFNGDFFILHTDEDAFVIALWRFDEFRSEYIWTDDLGSVYEHEEFTHYTPMPQFEEVKGGA